MQSEAEWDADKKGFSVLRGKICKTLMWAKHWREESLKLSDLSLRHLWSIPHLCKFKNLMAVPMTPYRYQWTVKCDTIDFYPLKEMIPIIKIISCEDGPILYAFANSFQHSGFKLPIVRVLDSLLNSFNILLVPSILRAVLFSLRKSCVLSQDNSGHTDNYILRPHLQPALSVQTCKGDRTGLLHFPAFSVMPIRGRYCYAF